ncbi:MAG: methyltransferase domain-containing protein [candidate division WOR-3 bacterium]|nr:methyltransferase domain-containing protein [candidate division WOR-3 bacterium]
MPHRFDPKNRAALFSLERQQRLPPRLVLQALRLKPGITLIDIGAGNGYFTLPALKKVGKNGTVIAVDIEPKMLKDLEHKIPAKTGNVRLLQAPAEKIPLPDAIADRALMALVLHEVDNKTAALREAHRLLKPAGLLAVLEWEKIKPPPGPPLSERISPAQLRKLTRAAGFGLCHYQQLNTFHYLALFEQVPNI